MANIEHSLQIPFHICEFVLKCFVPTVATPSPVPTDYSSRYMAVIERDSTLLRNL